ncbi:MAG: DMT family transporter [Planctomycetes bacterium]|nr:DMT family transporter [Planctomycetota bacterium]
MPSPDTPSERLRGHLALVVVQFCFGLFPLFGLTAMHEFAPLSVASWRMLFGAATLMGLAVLKYRGRAWVGWRELPTMFVLSLLGVVLNQAFFVQGLARSTSTNAGLVMCLIPVFTFVLAALLRQERLAPLRTLGVALSLAGGLLWFNAEDPQLVDEYATGNLLMAINALFYSGYIVLSKPVASRHPPLVILGWVYGLSLLSVPILAHGVELVPDDVSAAGWRSLAAVLVFPTFLGYLLNLYALERLRASTTTIYIYLQPLIAATAGWWLLGEHLTPAVGGAAAFIFVGIRLVARRPRRAASLPQGTASR